MATDSDTSCVSDGRFSMNIVSGWFEGAPLKPKPVQEPYPQVFQGGNSQAARQMAARQADVLFINGGSLEKIQTVLDDVKEYADEFGTEPPRFAANAFVIQRETEQEAKGKLEGIIENATEEAVEAFKEQVTEVG
ncbi:LLM class flavin-dependent oxidoreductase [Halovenus rubra]|uniref:LLM class flavin-dependent oxidoreductase n=2 Tax=Halovenus rubra TaxID=869890 RepID=A0ACC7DX57_9EURY